MMTPEATNASTTSTSAEEPVAVEMRHITKTWPGVVADDDASLIVRRGSIHALVGENGAGKSTLMNVLYGLLKADSGEIIINGKPAHISGPRDAIALGIGMVHQHFMLIPPLTVGENIVLGREPVRQGGVYDTAKANADIRDLSARYGLAIDPQARTGDLPVGLQQRVEILKVLYRGADILILDEPTGVLTPQETSDLFQVLRGLVTLGKTIIFITHKLREVLEVSDRVTVLRRGKVVGEVATKDTSEAEIARMMVGREVLLRVDKAPAKPGPVALRVERLMVNSEQGLPAVRDVSFELHGGEILGIAGVEGNGQSELVEALAGTRPVAGGRILLGERVVTNLGARGTRDAGIGHIPEDRRGAGLVLNYSIAENSILGRQRQPRFSWRGLVLRLGAIVGWARRLITQFDVRAPSEETHVKALSGGNQQKVIVARELASGPRVLLASQPTRGVDIGAIEFIHRRLVAQRDEGAAILLVSAELDEIRSLSDRIAVMYEGKIVSIESPDVPDERLGLLMTGGSGRQTQHSATA
ncbi:MAG TPA: ABC transporter ATP-binding protein [Ktedonobacterales bacterium]|nr:ABC transporter ATP-binding protein [Ktedonobacterales bacterium]